MVNRSRLSEFVNVIDSVLGTIATEDLHKDQDASSRVLRSGQRVELTVATSCVSSEYKNIFLYNY